MAPITARNVADWMILKAYSEPSPLNRITNKKVQKLVYYAQAWHLASSGAPLFADEIQAWVHGPVVPSLYRAFKEFGYNPIVFENLEKPPVFDDPTEALLNEIWEEYGGFDANYLEELTHHEAPWQIARSSNEFGENRFLVIEHEWMAAYYRSLTASLDN